MKRVHKNTPPYYLHITLQKKNPHSVRVGYFTYNPKILTLILKTPHGLRKSIMRKREAQEIIPPRISTEYEYIQAPHTCLNKK